MSVPASFPDYIADYIAGYPAAGLLGGAGIPAIAQWALNFFYPQNSQYVVILGL